MYTVAVSYLEWIRWVATGWFRCADRVVWVEGCNDQSGIDAMLDRTPDLQVSDDQGYVIACLGSNSLFSGRISGRERSMGHIWLSMAAVSSFHPLSIRGARLLEADAERAAVRLGEPIFEKVWADWRDRRLEEEAHWRGLSLCAAFGLDKPVLKESLNQVDDILAGRKAAPNAAKVRDDAIDGTRALGWASAMSIAVMDSDVRVAFSETSEFEEIKSLIKAQRNDFDLRRPLLDDEATVSFVRGVDGVLRKLGAQVLPLDLMAIVMHYRSLATGSRQLTLDALIDDLVAIALEDPHHASLAAYFIGRSMENVAVSTLLYQSEPARYVALAPASALKQLNVMTLAAGRLEAIQPVEEGPKGNPDGATDTNPIEPILDPTIGSGAVSRGEQQEDERPSEIDGAHSQIGESYAVSVSSTVTPGEGNAAGLATGSLVIADPLGELIPPPDAGAGEEINQPESSSMQSMTDLFPQPMDENEPAPVSVKARKKKKEKKSDKSR